VQDHAGQAHALRELLIDVNRIRVAGRVLVAVRQLRVGRTEEARLAYERALELARNEPERRFLERRIEEL
jgi:predicted RNA polymerase sigma factor